jgi:hypothetical protein
MPITYVSGDPLLTDAQILAFGHNVKGRTESGIFETLLLNHYPAAFATFGKNCRGGKIKTGSLWIWRESQPALGFMVVRESSVGATRLRYVEAVALGLARDFRLEGILSIAIAPLGDSLEWPTFKPVLDYWLDQSALSCVVYERYVPGIKAEIS